MGIFRPRDRQTNICPAANCILRLQGEPYAVACVHAAMFNAAIGWREFELNPD